MSTSDGSETRQSWRCGEYRIELAAPRLWVVTRERVRRFSNRPVVDVEGTTGSLVTANGLVAKLHRKHCAERSLRLHLAVLALVIAAAVAMSSAAPPLTAPAVLVTMLVTLRILTRAIDLVTGRSWEQVSQTYQ